MWPSTWYSALSQMEHFMCTCVLWSYHGRRVCVSVKSTGVPFLILAFSRVLASAQFAAVMRPRSALLPSLRWGELRGRLLPDSQSGITSRKCGLRGRPWGFRVHVLVLVPLKCPVVLNSQRVLSFTSALYVHYLQSWASAYSKHGQNATEALIICCTLLYYLKISLLSSSQN